MQWGVDRAPQRARLPHKNMHCFCVRVRRELVTHDEELPAAAPRRRPASAALRLEAQRGTRTTRCDGCQRAPRRGSVVRTAPSSAHASSRRRRPSDHPGRRGADAAVDGSGGGGAAGSSTGGLGG